MGMETSKTTWFRHGQQLAIISLIKCIILSTIIHFTATCIRCPLKLRTILKLSSIAETHPHSAYHMV